MVRRVRQHVNPLSNKYQTPATVSDWSVYPTPEQPLHLDIGCGRGYFIRQMAQLQPDWNFLGLEIRQPLVAQALQWRDQQQQQNLHFVFCNANQSLRSLFANWSNVPLQRVTIQFPDPWFKKRHQKRRVVQPGLIRTLAELMPPGAEVILQSDVEAVAAEMTERFAQQPYFTQQPAGWLSASPFPAQTEREQMTIEKGQPVFRSLFVHQSATGSAPAPAESE
ncbi:MAG: tRNA (guanosine(46)-N7)-methyltransferase TrmB [Leptolyngbyaceae cyanobacterium SM1_1_3]|nr:tRNA (guanosine(46)-N7)-methyltransferase TrmB [Leptolyngbyaceae cyanobacterium SM1_1_3]NJN04750.1 tRNA (guanosine(46)-N7)-methyltransferase TrmB [Leptolyngbyaceae cyanobacterium RM1_1_2]NJO11121.1 tRNA (guanosine(46)-N7)-methyltransferase TrmB [Leptolyngbyaceae cyanobacterium SL_1_1]